ncbi:hypothetical protein OX284_015990 [Flavobacterium sp. SUN046]|uniref:hypothetical protein n=1 Tax=Flavobacterium sp. SUN046 TaxID=3002440 RepID=UPI002DB9825A|nr:hypothetical protein [Flavobacterium sp. SUN046]MEC4050938.1 hypothetical protein [Flavobacterium sp. SUN046]
MKKLILIIVINIFYQSFAFKIIPNRYDFENFNNTPLWSLAQSIRNDNINEMYKIIKAMNPNVDFKDPNYQQTLLALAIYNNKPNTFIELLKIGANPNIILGEDNDTSPLICAINTIKECNIFYVENLLKYGANPNMQIMNPKKGYLFNNSFPLINAISTDLRCLNLVKLLVNNGADINCCYKQVYSVKCEGVIDECLMVKNMAALKYFVIEKNIKIPDSIFIYAINKKNERVYNLLDILRSEEFALDDFEDEKKIFKISYEMLRKERDEIIEFLKKKKE